MTPRTEKLLQIISVLIGVISAIALSMFLERIIGLMIYHFKFYGYGASEGIDFGMKATLAYFLFCFSMTVIGMPLMLRANVSSLQFSFKLLLLSLFCLNLSCIMLIFLIFSDLASVYPGR